jgi:hypothetical protein
MLAHAEIRPLWAVMLFAPWLVLGAAYLLKSARRRFGAGARAVQRALEGRNGVGSEVRV